MLESSDTGRPTERSIITLLFKSDMVDYTLNRRWAATRTVVVLTVLCGITQPFSVQAFYIQKNSAGNRPFCSVSPAELCTSTTLRSQERASPNNNRKKLKGSRFSQTVHQPKKGNSKFNADRMWKNNKSIEDMEERLAARWGTELKTWTAQDGEYDDDDDDDEMDPSAVVSDDVGFRARPVKDPWQSEETSAPKPSFFGGENDEALSRRASMNQKKLKDRKGGPEAIYDQPEFYDHDDVGYEPRRSDSRDKIQVDDLIAPKPVGGKGTFKNDHGRGAGAQESFFFSTPDHIAAQEGRVIEEEKPKRREEKARSPSLPILDEDGNPLFLTLEQAERNFAELLADAGSEVDEVVFSSDSADLPNRYRSQETMDWEDLGVSSPALLENLERMGCDKPLAVQEKSCSSVLEGKDVLVGTYTGSGKTLSFLVPLVQRLITEGTSDANVKTIIIAPGRELASQIVSVARDLLQGTGISVMLAIGGTTFSRNLEQIRKRKPAIIIGTPGRIAELVVGQSGERSGRLKINGVESLVLDEFDALLEYKPHRDPTNAIIQRLKKQHGDRLQSVLCSATASDLMGSPKLENYLREDYAVAMADEDDVLVTSAKGNAKQGKSTRVSRTVIHGVVHVAHRRFALSALRSILHTEPLPQQVLIFAENSRKVQIVVEKLEGMGIIAAPLHGGAGSEKMDRAEVSKALREGYVGIVVATEMAARGLDAPLLTHVVNLDLPTDASHYAHRAGRCGRGGRPGVVINLTTSPQERNVPQKFADKLGIEIFAVEPRNGKLGIVEPSSQDLD